MLMEKNREGKPGKELTFELGAQVKNGTDCIARRRCGSKLFVPDLGI